MTRTRIKICGLTSPADARGAVAAGADAIGLNFFPASSRYLAPEMVGAIDVTGVQRVGVFVNADLDTITTAVALGQLSVIQLHGDEPPELLSTLPADCQVIRARRLDARGLEAILQDLTACTAAGRTPDAVLVDHLAFGARLGLMAGGVPHADVVLGHPSALTVGEEVYGYPTAWPRCLDPDAASLVGLRALCEEVRDTFTEQWNLALEELAPGALPATDAFAETGDVLLLNYPAELHEPERTALLPAHTFLGSAVREEGPDPEVEISARTAVGSTRPGVAVREKSRGSLMR